MQVGLPIVSTDNGGQVDFIKNGINGYLLKYGDISSLAKEINKFEGNFKLRTNFSNLNRISIKNFKSERICEEYVRMLE
jgi:glycosyltransferase involved in cell wall biosynthesis